MKSTQELSPTSLRQIAGGMSCDQAIIASKVFTVIGDVFARGGDPQDAGFYYGMATGTLGGGC